MLLNRALYLLALLAASLFVYYQNGFFPSALFFSVLLFPLVSLIHLAVCFNLVTVQQSVSPSLISHRQKTQYRYTMHNDTSLFFPPIRIHFVGESIIFKQTLNAISHMLPPHSSIAREADLECRYRGVYPLGISSLEMQDILGLFRITTHNLEAKTVTVLPKITELASFYLPPKAHGDKMHPASSANEEPESFYDVRAYSPGDSLKHIHWKLSARSGKWLVRSLEQSSMNHTLFFLDTLQGPYSFENNIVVEDKLIEALVSLGRLFIQGGHRLNLIFYRFGIKSFTYSSLQEYEDFYHTVAPVLFSQRVSASELIEGYIDHLTDSSSHRGSDAFIFTCHPKDITQHPIIGELVHAGLHPHLVACTLHTADFSADLGTDSLSCYALTPNTDLGDVFEGVAYESFF